MSKTNVAPKRLRASGRLYTLYSFRVPMRVKRDQLALPFPEWEEQREKRAFGPPGKRAFR